MALEFYAAKSFQQTPCTDSIKFSKPRSAHELLVLRNPRQNQLNCGAGGMKFRPEGFEISWLFSPFLPRKKGPPEAGKKP